jgi:hypothetical protein
MLMNNFVTQHSNYYNLPKKHESNQKASKTSTTRNNPKAFGSPKLLQTGSCAQSNALDCNPLAAGVDQTVTITLITFVMHCSVPINSVVARKIYFSSVRVIQFVAVSLTVRKCKNARAKRFLRDCFGVSLLWM